jgi:peptidoglycan/LPS O-acetylase OafA/YrhL
MRPSAGKNTYSQLQSALLLPSIPALHGIRAIGILLVILYHLRSERTLPFVPAPQALLAFFILSGFLITWLLLKEEEKFGSISLQGFYRRRVLRIFPAFYVFWIVAVAFRVMIHGRNVAWMEAFSAFFYVSNYVFALVPQTTNYMIHTWSLSIEEQFYLLWPLSFLMFPRKRKPLMIGLAALIAAIWIHRVHIWMVARATEYITYAFDTRADALLVGCLLALALKEGLGKWLLERICRPVWAPLAIGLLIGISVFAGQLSEGYKLTGGLAIEPLLLAVLICQLVVHNASWPWKWLNAEPVVYLGKISYPMYLYHWIAKYIALRIPGLSTPLVVLTTIFLGIMMASCSYHFIEKPFLALKSRTSPPRRTSRIPLTSPDLSDRSTSSRTPAS